MISTLETARAPFFPTPRDRLIGAVVGGFRVERRIGAGMTSTVYLGRHVATGRSVALKVLHADLARRSVHERRFVREAWLAARLDHPNIVRVFECGRDRSTDAVFIATEHVVGGTLRDRLVAGGALGVEDGARLARQVACALAHLGERGVVHRDVKPANLLVHLDGTIKLADFGVALDVRSGVDVDLGGTPGTPRYMAPEQLRGAPVDHRADLYALGVTLYVALTGADPFADRKGVDLRQAKTTLEAPIPFRDDGGPFCDDGGLFRDDVVSRELVELVTLLIRRRPEERPRSAREVLETLSRISRPPTVPGSGRFAA